LLQKSFWGDERKFLEPLMRFTRGDVREPYRFIQNRSRISAVGAKGRRSRREAQRSTFARFFGFFDFRLLQQYLPKAEVKFTQDQWTGPIRENSFDPRRRNRDDTAMRLA
jgi:hypothetical protein